MNRDETAKVFIILKATYPYFYRDMTESQLNSALNLWTALFSQEPFADIQAAVHAMIKTRTSTFPPVPGEISDYLYKIKNSSEVTEQEAWNMVFQAVKKSAYNYSEEYNKLPDIIKKLVGSPQQLHDWSQMDADQVKTVVASNFMRSYRAKTKQQKEYNQLPAEVKKMIGKIGLLEDKNDRQTEVIKHDKRHKEQQGDS
jgi:cell division protein FtsB